MVPDKRPAVDKPGGEPYNTKRSSGLIDGRWFSILAAIKDQGTWQNVVLDIPLPDQESLGEVITFTQPARFDGAMVYSHERLYLEGEITAHVGASCADCLAPVQTVVTVPVDEELIDGGHLANDPDDERFCYENDRVDMLTVVETLVTLAMPLRYHCPEHLDKDGLSEPDMITIGHPEPKDQHPFLALKDWLTKDEED